ncbi:hypothetical protein KDAU_45710 [Dictyobacter aurantiacus]|uniref:DUF2207 domain-containing protein n=2 Tax=Dictyobacter aurantiacus TaxID=1936993 RepID=A0A401ZK89_9CHLR|nr:hypothetical protein KDAU_45710 [Dictyobacter aurantiacus]
MVIHLAGGPFTSFTRDLTSNKGGGRVTLEQASLQNDPFNGRSEIEIGGRRNTSRIIWRFPAISDASLTFVVSYRASSVVQQASDADLLQWFAIPTEHDYAIDSSTVTVHYPVSAHLLRTPDAGGIPGTRVPIGVCFFPALAG